MKRDGAPLRLSEMLALVDGAVYIERTSVTSPKNVRNTRRAIKKAFRIQMEGLGYSLVEILSPCPTNWKMSPVDACKWIDTRMTQIFPLGVIKDSAPDIK